MKKYGTHFLASILVAGFSTFSFAGQSGYLLNGQVIVTHIDGKEVAHQDIGETTERKVDTKQKTKRTPANFTPVKGLIQFDEDNIARCYWLSNQTSLQCIKK